MRRQYERITKARRRILEFIAKNPGLPAYTVAYVLSRNGWEEVRNYARIRWLLEHGYIYVKRDWDKRRRPLYLTEKGWRAIGREPL